MITHSVVFCVIDFPIIGESSLNPGQPFAFYIYIYIYIYIGSKSSLIQISLNIFCLYIFFWIRLYCFYRIRWELIYVLSIVVYIPSTFCPTLGHHQGRIYYKSDVTFVFTYYYYVRASLPLESIVFGCTFLICSALRISSFCLLF